MAASTKHHVDADFEDLTIVTCSGISSLKVAIVWTEPPLQYTLQPKQTRSAATPAGFAFQTTLGRRAKVSILRPRHRLSNAGVMLRQWQPRQRDPDYLAWLHTLEYVGTGRAGPGIHGDLATWMANPQ